MEKIINIGLAAFMLLAIGACGGEKTVTMGNQKWMAKNLNDASKGGKCYEDKPENCEKYGRLYTWEEAKNACPSGWHLPSDEEWEALFAFAGGSSAAGGKLKAKSGWEKGGGGTDEYGFSALPGGRGSSGGNFDLVGGSGSWWSSTDGRASAYTWAMFCDDSKVDKNYYDKFDWLSVRCVKN